MPPQHKYVNPRALATTWTGVVEQSGSVPSAPPAKCAHDGSVEALTPEPCPELLPVDDPRASYSPGVVFLEEIQAVQRACDAMERRAQRTLRAYPVCGFHSQPVHIYWRLDRANKAIRGAWYCVHCHSGKS